MSGEDTLSLEEFLELHPWPRESLELGRPLEWLWHYDLAAKPDALWRHVIDTSRLNRALGLSRMELEERDGVLRGRTRYGGFEHIWSERPWDWVAGRYLLMIRDFDKGFGHQVRVVFRLEERGDGARLYLYTGWIPRSVLGALALRIGVPPMKKDYRRVFEGVAAHPDEERPPPYLHPVTLPPERLARIHEIRDRLAREGLDSAALETLVWYVSTADDMDIYRIQVRALAHRWNVDEDELLRACLHATRAGLLQMSWDVVCPHCRGVREELRTLGDVPVRGSCQVCDIDFETDRERALEITFHVHPSIREVEKVYYCSAEPSSKMHIHVQERVEPGAEMQQPTRLRPGRYRLRLRGDTHYGYLDVSPAADRTTVEWHAAHADDLRATPRPRLRIVNDSDAEQIFVVEEPDWVDDALRPVHLFNFQDFRDLFSEEYVATDTQLSVGEQTILFTDIVGSTRFYVDRGDPGAFMEVKRHFASIYDIVRRHRGAVVKTIGDAAMAAFSGPVDALEAAREIHACFHEGRRDTPVRLRISLNTGPCIAVNLNSSIDYFGNAVNLAAKLQACAEAGDIAISDHVYRAPGVAAYLEREAPSLATETFTHDAFPEPVTVYRWATFSVEK